MNTPGFPASARAAVPVLLALILAIALFAAAGEPVRADISLNGHSIVVSPNTGLTAGSTPSVSASFPGNPNVTVIVVQCNPAAVLDHMDLGGNGSEGCYLAGQKVTSADGSGNLTCPNCISLVTGELQNDGPDPIDSDVCPPTPAQEAAGTPHCTVQAVALLTEHGGVAEIAFTDEEGVAGSAACSDLEDNDVDSLVDGDDPDCQQGTFCVPSGPNFDGDGPARGGTGAGIGNGTGIAGDDATVPNSDPTADNCDGDDDNDGIPDGVDPDPRGDNTYDDNNDGTWKGAGDDGPSWDTDGDSIRDGVDLGTSCSNTSNVDTDLDGLIDKWEVCKWGTDPADLDGDSDQDGKGDCKEAADVNGDGVVDFVGDTIFYAKAALLPAASFGKDGDFDINGDGVVDFVGDVIQEAKFALISNLCK